MEIPVNSLTFPLSSQKLGRERMIYILASALILPCVSAIHVNRCSFIEVNGLRLVYIK